MKLFDPRRAPCAAALFFCAHALAHAGRPMATDDAVILDPGACQLESGLQGLQPGPRQAQLTLLPSCRVGDWELAAGASLARLRADAGAMLQAKTVLRPLQPGGWGLGLVIASQFDGASAPATRLNVPVSLALAGDAVRVHLNAGAQRSQGRTASTWAIGTDMAAGARAAVTAETYGNSVDGASVRLGLRYSVLPGRLDADLSVSRPLHANAANAAPSLIAAGFTLSGWNLR